MRFQMLLVLSGLTALFPVLALPAAVSLNGTCEAGNCSSPDVLTSGQTTGGTLGFTYTFANGDEYAISGQYGGTYTNGSITPAGSPSATYLGNASNSTAASQADVLAFSILQTFNYTSGSLNGFYFYQFTSNTSGPIASSSTYTGDLSYDGESIGAVTVDTGYSGTSGFNQACFGDSTLCSMYGYPTLPALTDPVTADLMLSLAFGAGSGVGASISTVTPEPSSILLLALGGLSIFGFKMVNARRDAAAQNRS